MRLMTRTLAPIALAAALAGCSLGGLLGGGAKAPPTHATLTPASDPRAKEVLCDVRPIMPVIFLPGVKGSGFS